MTPHNFTWLSPELNLSSCAATHVRHLSYCQRLQALECDAPTCHLQRVKGRNIVDIKATTEIAYSDRTCNFPYYKRMPDFAHLPYKGTLVARRMVRCRYQRMRSADCRFLCRSTATSHVLTPLYPYDL